MPGPRNILFLLLMVLFLGAPCSPPLFGQPPSKDKEALSKLVQENYTRRTVSIRMRDGVKLHTIIYSPKDTAQEYPILLMRTPYSVAPYEEDKFRASLGPNHHFVKEGYIFAYQDVRGRFMSEGTFVNMRPQKTTYASDQDIDESTDTYDTIDWMIKHVSGNNGKVGQYGISYPGFYTSAGMINAHPNLKAASPQAPIADWFFDDFFHHGAFFLTHSYNFFASSGLDRAKPSTEKTTPTKYPTKDGYDFYLKVGATKNLNDQYLKNRSTFFKESMDHPNYDDFWKARNLLPHLKKVAPAVMTVGGWYDAEDLYGILNTYQAVEKQNPGVFNVLVVGPWAHGQWSSSDGSKLGNISFGSNTCAYYQREVELAFFNHFLKGKGDNHLPEALVFETGRNEWRSFKHWPPKESESSVLYLQAESKLSSQAPTESKQAQDDFISDPRKPVPFTEAIAPTMTREYMTDDQRFASKRPDVLVYQTDILSQDLTIAGPVFAKLNVATTGTDADWIVKIIDVFPDDIKESANGRPLAGYQMHVRSEVIRGRFRKSYETPEPFIPGQATNIDLKLQDILHTFQKGHRLMVQVHSTWFPLVDRNPQKFVPNIFFAKESDYQPATHTVFRSGSMPSRIEFHSLSSKK